MSSIATKSQTVRDLALEIPNATRVFEKLGIDYCCGGGKSLEQACQGANLNAGEVMEMLQKASVPDTEAEHDFKAEPLADLIEHIIATHHKYVREEIARLQPLFVKVCSAHGQNHPELRDLRNVFTALAQELTTHMMKEEMVLFPYIVRMEEAVVQNEPVLPAPFGTVENPIHMMEYEHDSAGRALRELRALSSGYQAPADACLSYRTLYEALEGFEKDLHQHIHKENNILHPRALAMERAH